MSAMPGPVLFGQLSDTHVVGNETTTQVFVDNNERLRLAVESICAEEPPLAAVLVTGDLVEDGRPSEYAELAALLHPIEAPVLPIPGNHDDRDLVRSTFPHVEWVSDEHLSWVQVVAGVRIVGLDSIRPGRPGGEFDEVRATWLSSVLDQPHDGPTILALHHPPFASGIDWMDRSGLVGIDRFREVIAGSVVDRILCGHLHRPMTSVVAGVVAQVGISTVQHVALDLTADATTTLIHDPVGYQIHRVIGRDIVTHVRYFDIGAEPFAPPPRNDA